MQKRTIEILKNFSTINSKILFVEGNELRIINEIKSNIGVAVLPDTFTKEFGMYDLNEFLGVYSLFDEPKLSYSNDYLEISEKSNNNKVKYKYSPTTIIKNVYGVDMDAKLGDELVTFKCSKNSIDTLKKASGVLALEDIQITSEGVTILNTESNGLGNEFTIDTTNFNIIDEDGLEADTKVIMLSDLSLISDSYEVTICENIAKFKADNGDIVYYVTYKDID